MPGPPGRPGKSISAPQATLSPAEQTRDEGENTAFYCTVTGSPSPVVEWQFKGRKLLSGAKYLIKEGELIVRNLNYSDAGPYTCVARNILGSSEAISNLTVRGKRNTVLLLYLAAWLCRSVSALLFNRVLLSPLSFQFIHFSYFLATSHVWSSTFNLSHANVKIF